MIEVDLLPVELREKEKVSYGHIFQTKLIFIVLGGLILGHLFLQGVIFINKKRIDILERKWQGLSVQRGQINELRGALAKINQKVPLIEQLISKRVLWSRKLNRISDLIIPGIWLNKLTIKEQEQKPRPRQKTPRQAEAEPLECLIIRGSAASRSKDEPALIGRFMQNLKDDAVFSADFSGIELGPIKKRLIEQTQVMDFTLICWFKDE